MISMTKTYYTRDGRQTRVLCVDAVSPAGHTVVVLVRDKGTGTEGVFSYFADGRYVNDGFERAMDLIEQGSIPEMLRATPEHCIRLPDAGYDTTVGDLIGSSKALREYNDKLEKECKESATELEQLGAVLEAIQKYLPKQSVPYLLAQAALDGEPLS